MSRMKAMNKIVQFETPEQKADRLETEVKELKAEVESLKRDLSTHWLPIPAIRRAEEP
jgi:outer membrane murein-binding lipoprotein Lpp